MKEQNHYKVVVNVQNGLGVIARITILLRKFNVNIQSIDGKPLDENKEFYDIRLILDTEKDEQGIYTVMKKLERLVPVIKVSCKKINGG